MLKNIAKKIITHYLKHKWSDGTEWINQIQPIFFDDAREFLSKQGFLRKDQSIEDLAQMWSSYVANLFNASSPDEFYPAWIGDVGASNIAANIFDQFSRPYVASGLIRTFGQHYFTGTLLDYGCGTAAISLSWQRDFANHSRLLLSDVENLSREFSRYYIKKHPNYKIELVAVDLEKIQSHTIDAILCIHVLEHLPNPSDVFRLIDSKLKGGGILILEAPWGGHPTHLKEAPIEWKENGGQKLLKINYKPIMKMNRIFSISGVYKKK